MIKNLLQTGTVFDYATDKDSSYADDLLNLEVADDALVVTDNADSDSDMSFEDER